MDIQNPLCNFVTPCPYIMRNNLHQNQI